MQYRLASSLIAAFLAASCGGSSPQEQTFAAAAAAQRAPVAEAQCATGNDGMLQRAWVDGQCVVSSAAAVAWKAPQGSLAATTIGFTALLDWAQRQYPQHFRGTSSDGVYDGYTYRFYPTTGNYIGLKGQDVYLLGPVAGNVLAAAGTLASFNCTVAPENCVVTAPASPVQASAGVQVSSVVRADGSGYTWGTIPGAMLGQGDLSGVAAQGRVQAYVQRPVKLSGNVRSLALGIEASAGVGTDGSLWTWGSGANGLLGTGVTSALRWTPAQIGTGYTQVSIGYRTAAAVRQDGTVVTWGYQLQSVNSAPVVIATPQQTGGSGFTAVSVGNSHALALKSDGTLWGWGDNSVQQLGTTGSSATPMSAPVQIGSGYKAIAAGPYTSFGIKTDGTLWGWGGNSFGQAGTGSADNVVRMPTLIGSGFASVSAGNAAGSVVLALKTDGTMWGWGTSDGKAVLGVANAASRVPVQTGSGYAAVAVGGEHAVGVKNDGSIYQWGNVLPGGQTAGQVNAETAAVVANDPVGTTGGTTTGGSTTGGSTGTTTGGTTGGTSTACQSGSYSGSNWLLGPTVTDASPVPTACSQNRLYTFGDSNVSVQGACNAARSSDDIRFYGGRNVSSCYCRSPGTVNGQRVSYLCYVFFDGS